MSFIEGKTGFETRLTPQQQSALNELKARMEKTEHWPALESHPDGDRWILRFMRATMKDKHGARIFQVDQAEARLIRTLEWRKKFKADEVMHGIMAGDVKSVTPVGADVSERQMPKIYVADDATGEVYRFDRFSKCVSYMNVDALTLDQWSECVVLTMESCLDMLRVQSKKQGKEISTYTTVVDSSGVSITGIVARRKFVQFMSDIGAEHYPESLGKTFLVNCPWYFDKIWNIAKAFIDKDTLSKLSVNSGLPMEEMLKLIPKNILLKEFGGDNEVVLPTPDFS